MADDAVGSVGGSQIGPYQPGMPDPTDRVTKQLLQEIGALRREVGIQIKNLEEVSDSRFDSQEKINIEKFDSVKTQFKMVEQQRIEQKEDTKAAVDAALAAQKEAAREQTISSEKSINKSEASTKEQLGQLATNFATELKGVVDKLNDISDRIGRIEAVKQGGMEARQVQDRSSDKTWQIVAAMGGLILVVLGILTFVIANLPKR